MHFFAEAICILLRLYAGLCENIDHLSPAEARAGTEPLRNPSSNDCYFNMISQSVGKSHIML